MSEQSVSINVNTEGKNMVVAYLLWFFLGYFGIHRFYLGKVGSGLAQLLLMIIGWVTSFIFIGFFLIAAWFIWWLLDAYFVQQYVTDFNNSIGVKNSTVVVNKSVSSTDDLDKLERLHDLKEKGIITEEEFEEKRSEIMGKKA